MNKQVLNLNEGELVEVKMAEDISETLDQNCEFEALPFMDEMRQYCGKRLVVLKRVEKIIVEGVGVRYLKNTVILKGADCSGIAHGGCSRTCPILWKEAWLKRPRVQLISVDNYLKLTEPTSNQKQHETSGLRCQSISLVNASSDLPPWNPKRYMLDIRAGNFRPMMASFKLVIKRLLTGKSRSGLPLHVRRTPTITLNLKPGELIEVKSKEEIFATLDSSGKNRGLEFTPEMEKYCGKEVRVLRRMDKMFNETTGEMRQIANTVILEGTNCDGHAHGGCPRSCYCLWREIWLRRAGSK